MRCFDKIKRRLHLSPARFIAIGFLSVILVGGLLLFLPISHRRGVSIGFSDALFTSVSSVCVTGLAVVDIADTFNVFGRIIMMILIQIGGMGVATMGVLIIVLTHRHVGFSGRQLVRESMNLTSLGGSLRLLLFVFKTAAIIESAGAVLTFLVLMLSPNYSGGVGEAIGISLFHAVSAFNNAGFDLFGGFSGLSAFQGDIGMSLVTSALIISGGIGFVVIAEVIRKRHFRRFSLHTKTALSMTAVLLIAGTLLFYLTELQNGISFTDAFFTSVTARTAGFSTYPISSLSDPGLLLMMVLMFIGASSGSTGGGIKTGTTFVLLAAMVAFVRGRKTTGFCRRIPDAAVRRALLLLLFALMLVLLGSFLLMWVESNDGFGFADYLFEAVSAFATVGLSTGVTPTLGIAGKYILICMMYVGRLGPLSVATLFLVSKNHQTCYSEESIIIG